MVANDNGNSMTRGRNTIKFSENFHTLSEAEE